MIILNGTTESLLAVLAASVATTQPTAITSYADTPGTGAGDNSTALNGTTAVTIAASPASSTQRVVRFLSIYNGDSAAVVVTINKLVSGTNFPLVKVRLQPGFTLTYTGESGWQVVDTNGAVQTTPSPVSAFPSDFISGLKMVWNSATSVSVTTGEAYIPSLGRLSTASSLITLSGLSLSASTWYHLYLYENAGITSVECVTTAPAAAYFGTARCKTGDTSRRYVGSLLTDASGNIYNFSHIGNAIKYLTTVAGSPFFILSGTASTSTNVSCAGIAPVTATAVSINAKNNDTVQTLYLANSLVGAVSSSNFLLFITSNGLACTDIAMDSSQNFNYTFGAAPTSNAAIRAYGYIFER